MAEGELNLPSLVQKLRLDLSDFKASAAEGEAAASGFIAKITGAIAAHPVLSATAAITGALLKIGESFEKTYNNVRVQTGATGKTFDELKTSVKNTLAGTSASFDQAGQAVSTLYSRTGLTGKALTDLAKQEVNLARITHSDLSSNVKEVTALMNNWGVSTKSQGKELDVLFKAGQQSGQGIQSILRPLTIGAPIFKQFGFDLNHSAALLSILEKRGIPVNYALAGMRSALVNITKASAESAGAVGKHAKAMSDAQKAASEWIVKGNPTATLQKLTAGLQDGKTHAAAYAEALKLFGSRAGPYLADALSRGALSVDALSKAISNGKDGINATTESVSSIGDKLARMKNEILVTFEPLASLLIDFANRGLGFLLDKIREVGPWVTAFFAVIRSGFEGDLNLSGIGLALQVVGFNLARLRDYALFIFGEIRDAAAAFWGGLIDPDSASKATSGFQRVFAEIGAIVRNTADAVLPTIGEIWKVAVAAATVVFNDLRVVVVNTVQFLADHRDQIAAILGKIGDIVKGIIERVLIPIFSHIKQVADVVGPALVRMFSAIVNFIKTDPVPVLTAVAAAIAAFTAGSTLGYIASLVDGLQNLAKGLKAVFLTQGADGALMLSSFGWVTVVAVAVVALGIAFYELYQHVQWFHDFADTAGRDAAAFADVLDAKLAPGVANLTQAFVGWAQGTIGPFRDVQAAADHLFRGLKVGAEAFVAPAVLGWRVWGDQIKQVFAGLVSIAGPYLGFLKDSVRNALEYVRGVFDVFLGGLAFHWARVWKGLGEIASGFWGQVGNVAGFALDLIRQAIVTGGQVLEGVWRRMFDTLADIETTALHRASDIAASGVDTVVRTFRDHWQVIGGVIAGPVPDAFVLFRAQLTAGVGASFTGLRSLVTNHWKDALLGFATGGVSVVFGPLRDQLVGGLASVLSGVKDVVARFGSDVFAPIAGGLSSAGSGIGGALGGFGSAIGGAVSAVVGVFAALPGQIGSVLAPLPGQLADVGAGVGRALLSGFEAAPSFAYAVLKWLGDALGAIVDFRLVLERAAGESIRGMIAGWLAGGVVAVNFFRELPGRLVAAFGSVKDLFTGPGHGLISGFLSGAESAWSATVAFFQGLPGRIVGYFSAAGSWLGNAGNAIVAGLAAGVLAAFPLVGGFFLALPDRIKGFFGAAGSWLAGAGHAAIDGFLSGAKSVWEAVTGWFRDLPSTITEYFADARHWLYDAGVSVVDGFRDGIVAAAVGFGHWVAQHLNPIDDVKAFLGISSPSTVFIELGKEIPAGFIIGILEGVTGIAGAAGRLGQAAVGGIGNLTAAGRDAVEGLASGARSELGAVTALFSSIPALVRGYFAGFGGLLITSGRDAVAGLLSGARSAWDAVAGFFAGIPGRVLLSLSPLASVLLGPGRAAMGSLLQGLQTGFGAVRSFVGGLRDQLVSAVGDTGSWLLDAGRQVVEGFKNGITDAGSGLGSVAQDVFGSIVGDVKSLFGITSPSKVFADIGLQIPAGLKQGLDSGSIVLDDAGAKVVGKVMQGMQSANYVQSAEAVAKQIGDTTDAAINAYFEAHPATDKLGIGNVSGDLAAAQNAGRALATSGIITPESVVGTGFGAGLAKFINQQIDTGMDPALLGAELKPSFDGAGGLSAQNFGEAYRTVFGHLLPTLGPDAAQQATLALGFKEAFDPSLVTDVTKAQQGYADSVRQTTDALAPATGAVDQHTHSLQTQTQAGSDAEHAIQGQADAIVGLASAHVALGGDVHQSAAEIGLNAAALEGQIEKSGVAKDAAFKLTEQVLGIPPEKATNIHNTADLAKAAIDTYLPRLFAIPPGPVNTDVTISGVQSAQQLLDHFITTLHSVPASGSTFHLGISGKPVPGGATGGLYTKPTVMLIGEAGPEVLLPLRDQARSLHLLALAGLLPHKGGAQGPGPDQPSGTSGGGLAAPSILTGAITNATSWLNDAGRQVVVGFRNGLSSAAAGMGEFATTRFAPVIAFVKRLFGISSPSQVFDTMGRAIPAGLAAGVQSGSSKALDAGILLRDQLLLGFDPATIQAFVNTGMTAVGDTILNQAESIGTAVKGLAGQALAALVSTALSRLPTVDTLIQNTGTQLQQNLQSTATAIHGAQAAWAHYRDAVATGAQPSQIWNDAAAAYQADAALTKLRVTLTQINDPAGLAAANAAISSSAQRLFIDAAHSAALGQILHDKQALGIAQLNYYAFIAKASTLPNINGIIADLNQQNAALLSFQKNLDVLIKLGDTQLAQKLAQAGPDTAGAIADAFAKSPAKAKMAEAAIGQAQTYSDAFQTFLNNRFGQQFPTTIGPAANPALSKGIGWALTAEGGIFDKAQLRWIAEAGPEAVLPLNDPARALDLLRQTTLFQHDSIRNAITTGVGGGQDLVAQALDRSAAALYRLAFGQQQNQPAPAQPVINEYHYHLDVQPQQITFSEHDVQRTFRNMEILHNTRETGSS